MNKRRIAVLLIVTALAANMRRALFLLLMEFLSKGGLWAVFGALYIVWLLKGGKKALVCMMGYLILLTVLWFSNASYAPHDMDLRYEERELIRLSENLTEDAKENYTAEFDAESIIECAKDVMRMKEGRIIAFPYPEIFDKLDLSGVFLPYTGHAYINTNEKPFLLPYVAAHELSHRKGIVNEGQANIEAYIHCMNSDNRQFRYSASVYALKYALCELKSKNEAEYLRLESAIPTVILNDLNQMAVCKDSAHGALDNYADLIKGLIHIQSITSQGVI